MKPQLSNCQGFFMVMGLLAAMCYGITFLIWLSDSWGGYYDVSEWLIGGTVMFGLFGGIYCIVFAIGSLVDWCKKDDKKQ